MELTDGQREQLVTEFLQLCFFDSYHNQAAGEEILRLRAKCAQLEQKALKLESGIPPARAKRSGAKKLQEDEDTEDAQVGR